MHTINVGQLLLSVCTHIGYESISQHLLITISSYTLIMSLHRSQGIIGRDITPFILNKVNDMTKGESLEASIQPLMPVVWTIVFTDCKQIFLD